MIVPPATDPLVALGRWLQTRDYRFITCTPTTHARVNARPGAQQAHDLRDVFGWSRPFAADLVPPPVLQWLQEAGMLLQEGNWVRSAVRFSFLGGQLYAHSSYPTVDAQAVFFGPDSYRFANWIESELRREPLPGAARILDVGCGAGPGGMVAALAGRDENAEVVLADINPHALRHARVNAQLAGLDRVGLVLSDLYAHVSGEFDLIVANPPYLVDPLVRTYRNGGGPLGGGLSQLIVAQGLPRLRPGGRLLLYTGAAMVDGDDPLQASLRSLVPQRDWGFDYRELDPDVFGEELEAPAYQQAERIAAVGLVLQRPVDSIVR